MWDYSVTEKCEIKEQRAVSVAFLVEEAERWLTREVLVSRLTARPESQNIFSTRMYVKISAG